MSRASFAAAFAASLSFGFVSVSGAADGGLPSADGRFAEERLLGSADEDAQYLACQPFTREIAADGVVSQARSTPSLAKAGVPAAAMLEARQALATSLDLGRDIGAGDRFYVRYQRLHRGGRADRRRPHAVGRAAHQGQGHDRPSSLPSQGGAERLWLANGEAATPPSMRLPLDTMTVSSGYGLRADPLDKPAGTALAMGPLPIRQSRSPAAYMEKLPAPAPEQPVVAPPEPVKPARRRGEVFTGQPGFGELAMNSRPALDGAPSCQRLVAERDAEARRAGGTACR